MSEDKKERDGLHKSHVPKRQNTQSISIFIVKKIDILENEVSIRVLLK